MRQWYRRLVTLVIAGCIGGQALVVALRIGPWYWPWMDYPMYSRSHVLGDEAEHVTLTALTAGGEVPLDAGDFGLSYHIWRGEIAVPLAVGEPIRFHDLESSGDLLAWLAREREDLALEGLRARREVYVLGPAGLVLDRTDEKTVRP